jgi:lysophospholipase L1-like esterase
MASAMTARADLGVRATQAGGRGRSTRRAALQAGLLVAAGVLAVGCTAPRPRPGTTTTGPPTTAKPGTTASPTTAPTSGGPPAAGHIYIAGDSTAMSYPASYKPQAGWGQAFPLFITGGATVSNQAIGGRSTRSFIGDGRLTRILDAIKPNDVFLITFGHNDEGSDPARHTDAATTYKSYLRQYVDGALAKRARPILLTPVERRHFDSSGRMTPTHTAYANAMKQVAAEKHVPIVDLTALSTALWNRIGPEQTKQYFLWAGDKQDNTHFQALGAIEVARLVATALRDQKLLPVSQIRDLSTMFSAKDLTWR